MKSTRLVFLLGLGIYSVVILIFAYELNKPKKELSGKHKYFEEDKFSNEPQERNEYFFRLLRDPSTNAIPYHIRERELKFAKRLALRNKLLKPASIHSLQWKEAGPVDVGGRTKATAVDVANSNNIIVGSASGGIWKSTDNGNSGR